MVVEGYVLYSIGSVLADLFPINPLLYHYVLCITLVAFGNTQQENFTAMLLFLYLTLVIHTYIHKKQT